jgi:hypothetical protein
MCGLFTAAMQLHSAELETIRNAIARVDMEASAQHRLAMLIPPDMFLT